MDAAEWDARYAAAELVWGAEPNRFVAAEFADVSPGRVLDIACGEGRNAIWLATQGWFAVGVDFSAVAVERARARAEQAGVRNSTEFVVGDAVAGHLPAGPFDAVVIAYLQLAATDRARAFRHVAKLVAPGGVLLVVGHDTTNLSEGVGGPQDPAVLFTPDDVVADIGDDFAIRKAQRVYRTVPTPEGERTAVDALVVATRR
jgi:ubiquinone/menaquinone biosynthesis C-methylase UbiE